MLLIEVCSILGNTFARYIVCDGEPIEDLIIEGIFKLFRETDFYHADVNVTVFKESRPVRESSILCIGVINSEVKVKTVITDYFKEDIDFFIKRLTMQIKLEGIR